jgi:hypothetical protein
MGCDESHNMDLSEINNKLKTEIKILEKQQTRYQAETEEIVKSTDGEINHASLKLQEQKQAKEVLVQENTTLEQKVITTS